VVEELGAKLGRSPTVAELARAVDAEEEDVLEALEAGQAYTAISLSTAEDDEFSPVDAIGVDEPGFDASEDRATLGPGLAALDERERRILHLRFVGGLTQSKIAQEIGISQMHVSRLIRRALEKLRADLEEGLR
jgi:RNA polymerase sigma-B factor